MTLTRNATNSPKQKSKKAIRLDPDLIEKLRSKDVNPKIWIENRINEFVSGTYNSQAQSYSQPSDIKDIVDQLISFLNNSDNNEQKESLKLALGIQSINIAAYFQKNIGDKLQDYIYGSAGSSFPIASLLAELVKMGLLNESAVPEQIRAQTQDADKPE